MNYTECPACGEEAYQDMGDYSECHYCGFIYIRDSEYSTHRQVEDYRKSGIYARAKMGQAWQELIDVLDETTGMTKLIWWLSKAIGRICGKIK